MARTLDKIVRSYVPGDVLVLPVVEGTFESELAKNHRGFQDLLDQVPEAMKIYVPGVAFPSLVSRRSYSGVTMVGTFVGRSEFSKGPVNKR